MGMIPAREWDNKIIDHGEGIRNAGEVLDLFDLASSDSLRYCIGIITPATLSLRFQ